MKIVGSTVGVTEKIKELYKVTAELENMFPGSKFTPDGHVVGSIGEVLVAEKYGLQLLDNSAKTHDAKTAGGKYVQIKATQTDKISISSEPQYLVVIRILKSGEWEEIYNGPGAEPWANAGKMQKNGQRSLSLAKLHNLMKEVPEEHKIQPVR